jgi:hypothetical protein
MYGEDHTNQQHNNGNMPSLLILSQVLHIVTIMFQRVTVTVLTH